MAALTFDIGGTKCALALVSGQEVTQRVEFATERQGPESVLAKLVSLVPLGAVFDRVGICFGGPVDFANQLIDASIHVDGWSGFDFPTWANREFGVRAVVDNDAKVGALAEQVLAPEIDPLLYVTISTGIGAGLISGGEVVRGRGNAAGELGHVVLDPTGPQCSCGSNGCLERICSGYWLEQDYGLPAQEVLARPESAAIYCRNLARGLRSAILLTAPQAIIFGGGVSASINRLLPQLRAALTDELGRWKHLLPTLQVSSLGSIGVHIGAGELARREIP